MMPTASSRKVTFRNVVLSRLSEEEGAALVPHLMPMDLPVGLELLSPTSSKEWVYLLERGVASVSAFTADGKGVEIGMIGREGVVGVSALLGHHPQSLTSMMQGSGDGYRIRASVLRKEMLRNPVLLQGIHDALYMQIVSFGQTGACNGMHEVEPRLSRWLLTASDLMETDRMDLTQEFLSMMLGTRRTTVSEVAGALQRRGLITYRRGHLTILDRAMLEKASCDCYATIREAHQRTFPDKPAL